MHKSIYENLESITKDDHIKIKVENLDRNFFLDDESVGHSHKSFGVAWTPVEGAKSYALCFTDYEASGVMGVPFVHWYCLNIKQPFLKFDSSNNTPGLIEGENTASCHFTHPIVNLSNNLRYGKGYFAPCPPNKTHKYEIKIYALMNELEGYDQDQKLYLTEFEKIIDQLGVITDGVLYVNCPRLTFNENRLMQKHNTMHTEPLIMKKTCGTYYMIEDLLITDLKLNYYDEIDLNYLKIHKNCHFKVVDNNRRAKAYAILITSNHLYEKYGAPFIHYARIFNKKDYSKNIPFLNTYGLRPDLTHFQQDYYRHLIYEFCILADPLYNEKNTYTINVYAIDRDVTEIRETKDKSPSGMFDIISGHVIGFISKRVKL
ncbi:YbhB/YbcL family Raf kinase inhibitor-like protein [Ureaplasma canigenitalium]|uniref:YbhB/YbcL family Raf kinase inhibitor-like protein n=1 Tax=Ureaplasma canigenitalium TaxID=42092 RepID=UPI0004E1946F|nr:YbhB/YbcL family Raf kinase inhibitor-like protein [Ureaplasma canigenitalium]